MSISYMDYTSPKTKFTYDLKNNLFYKKDSQNYINALSINQLNTLGNYSLLDIFLSNGGTIEPHYHQNASELVYCITGSAVVSLINPFTNQLLSFTITPGQVANVPQGWWHYEIATADNTHLLAVFDAPIPEVIFGSDILRLTPASVWANTYCLNEAEVKQTLAPLQGTVKIGPPKNCGSAGTENNEKRSPHQAQIHQLPGAAQHERPQQEAPQLTPPFDYQAAQQPVEPGYAPPFPPMPQLMQEYPMTAKPQWAPMTNVQPGYGVPQAGQQVQQAPPWMHPTHERPYPVQMQAPAHHANYPPQFSRPNQVPIQPYPAYSGYPNQTGPMFPRSY